MDIIKKKIKKNKINNNNLNLIKLSKIKDLLDCFNLFTKFNLNEKTTNLQIKNYNKKTKKIDIINNKEFIILTNFILKNH